MRADLASAEATTPADELLAALQVKTPRKLLEHLFAELGRTVLLLDQQRRIVFVSDGVADMFGYTPDELEGAPASKLIWSGAPDEELSSFLDAAILTDRRVGVYRRYDGTRFSGETTQAPIRGPHGDVLGALLIISDVSDLVAGEALLRSLHDATFDRETDLGRRLCGLLRLAADHFSMPMGALVRYEETGAAELVQMIGGGLEPGTRLSPGTLATDGSLRRRIVAKHRLRSGALGCEPTFAGIPVASLLAAPVRVEDSTYGAILFLSSYERRRFSEQDRELAALMASWIGREIARHRDQEQLRALATSDSLTGVANRRAIELVLGDEMIRFARSGRSAAVLLIDLDHFKDINDTLGHEAGDIALCAFTDAVSEALRAGDRLGRWGGDEFLVVLPETNAEGAWEVADRLQQAIRGVRVHHGRHTFGLKASIGVAVTRLGDTPSRLVARADSAVYRMKAAGRDGIEFRKHRVHEAD